MQSTFEVKGKIRDNVRIDSQKRVQILNSFMKLKKAALHYPLFNIQQY